MFVWYAREFHTVEINNSFYRLPAQQTFALWKKLSPRGFVFAVKASRFITHIKKLNQVEDAVKLLFSPLKPLGSSLGPVLFQLPPPRYQYVLEFRDPSWSSEKVYQLLRSIMLLCAFTTGARWLGRSNAPRISPTFDFMEAGDATLAIILMMCSRSGATLVERWRSRLDQIFIYFNNDIGGHAIGNARSGRCSPYGRFEVVGPSKRQ